MTGAQSLDLISRTELANEWGYSGMYELKRAYPALHRLLETRAFLGNKVDREKAYRCYHGEFGEWRGQL